MLLSSIFKRNWNIIVPHMKSKAIYKPRGHCDSQLIDWEYMMVLFIPEDLEWHCFFSYGKRQAFMKQPFIKQKSLPECLSVMFIKQKLSGFIIALQVVIFPKNYSLGGVAITFYLLLWSKTFPLIWLQNSYVIKNCLAPWSLSGQNQYCWGNINFFHIN